ncbi:hypothetical protein PVAND_012087 [Polypedilum vanderplanki]|uniref:AAA+ ATPase domain-containing protein n=1 Tax=Polypedilum vanderplanki TaxID=319348 RepID=A0A9J6CKI8_POLVA|nr:hypothetical protein PVAND_012087 [Polypedilum vanderplanki]
MNNENSRKNALGLLKLGSATMIDSYQRGLSEFDSVQRSNVFLQEYVDITASKTYQNSIKKQPFTHETTLTAADFFSDMETNSCECNCVSDNDVAMFVNQLEKKNGFSVRKIQEEMDIDEIEQNLITKSQENIKSRTNDSFSEMFNQKTDDNPFKKHKSSNSNNEQTSFQINAFKSRSNFLQQSDSAKNSLNFLNAKREQTSLKPVEKTPSISQKQRSIVPTKNYVQADLKHSFGLSQKQPQENIKQKENTSVEKEAKNDPFSSFKTGRQELQFQQNIPRFHGLKKSAPVSNNPSQNQQDDSNPLRKKFVNPVITEKKPVTNSEIEVDPLLKGFDKAILERIEREIVSNPSEVTWNDIIGLDAAKQVINESITIAMNHPEFFTGLRAAPKAILFFGPPGTGKTLIGKCIASSCSATFMSISASSLTSKWIGESEALVRAMFSYARLKQPSVIFFDEIDSLLEKRDSDSGGGNETYNRIKTEFLVQLDGVSAVSKNDRVLFIAATNLPHKIDEAILRRFSKRIFVPLPVEAARVALFKNLLANEKHRLSEEQFEKLGEMSEGYSGSDITQVCKEAAMKPLRKISNVLSEISVDQIPPISFKHFIKAFRDIKPSVSAETIKVLDDWNSKYGFSANLSQSDDDTDSDYDF